MSESSPKVAAIQMVTSDDLEANLLEAERLIRAAAQDGAQLAVLPESFAFMGQHERDVLAHRERDGEGPLQAFLSGMATRYRLWLVGGTIPLTSADGKRARAACLVIDDRGERVCRYDKMHLFDVDVPGGEQYRESSVIEPGEDILVVDSPGGRLGLAVCYDLRFPELLRRMLDQGMDLLALPAAFTAVTGEAHWDILVRARAIENLAYVIAAAQGGRHANGRQTYGHSMIVDPWGSVLAQRAAGTGFVCCAIERERQASVRRSFPAVVNRRLKCR